MKEVSRGHNEKSREACSHQVRRYDIQTTRFEVEEAFNPIIKKGGHIWSINLRRGTCQCGKYQAYKYCGRYFFFGRMGGKSPNKEEN